MERILITHRGQLRQGNRRSFLLFSDLNDLAAGKDGDRTAVESSRECRTGWQEAMSQETETAQPMLPVGRNGKGCNQYLWWPISGGSPLGWRKKTRSGSVSKITERRRSKDALRWVRVR